MTTPFVGEIRMFAGTFAPSGWAFCDGSLIQIRDNETLFSVIGSAYGGDGRTTFGLPDLRGRLPIHAGSGPGLTPRSIGQKGGAEIVSLSTNQVPVHRHDLMATADSADTFSPIGSVPALVGTNFWSDDFDSDPMAADGILAADGTAQSFSNEMPFAVIHFIISLAGVILSQT